MFANRKYEELSTLKKSENVRPHSSNSEMRPNYSQSSRENAPGARFSKVPIINGPGKLLPFTLKIEVFKSFVSNVITDYQLMKQNGVVC